MATRKSAATTRKPAARNSTPKPTQVSQVSEEERQAKLSAYHTLVTAGVEVPTELAAEVQVWIDEEVARREAEAKERAKEQAEIEKVNQKGPWWVRNGYRMPYSIRLDRQTERRRIELKPRGVPGDMHPLEDGDLNDPILKRNLQMGTVEVIPAGEADRILQKQTTNAGPRVHAPAALLRNAKGEAYEDGAIKLEAEFNKQGVTVATLDPRAMQGELSDKELKQSGGMQREVASQFVPTGGNPAIIESGPLPDMSDNARARIADDLARRKDLEGPAAGLGGLQVRVEPTQKSE